MTRLKLMRIGFAFTLTATLGTTYLRQSQVAYSQRAQGRNIELLAAVAQREGLPIGELEVASSDTLALPITGAQLAVAKVVDKNSSQTYLIAVDGAGKAVDLPQAQAAENAARFAAFGRIDPALAFLMARGESQAGQQAAGGNTIPVSIWLNISEPPVSRPDSPDQDARAALSAMLNTVQQYVAPRRQGLLDALSRMGAQPQASAYAPAVFANLTSGQIRAIAQRSDVGVIYTAIPSRRFNDDATTTERTYRAWAQGALGLPAANLGVPGVPPVVHEDDGISDFNPYLHNPTHTIFFWCSDIDLIGRCPSGKNIDSHATAVGGVIASTHPLFRGIAPNVRSLLSANFQSFEAAGFEQRVTDSFEWARGNGGNPTNMSWGSSCGGGGSFYFDRYVDWAVKNLAATFTISSGNTSGCFPFSPNDLYVSSPGIAWGAITVGAVDDNDTGFWSGDSVAGYSRYIDPPATGQDKPEVVAVGSGRRTTDDGGKDHLTLAGVDGTSFSAPAVAGQVSLMLGRKPGQASWPETNKAAVLVSAYHDIVAGTDIDGVGAVVMNVSDDTYRFNRFGNGSVSLANLTAPCTIGGAAVCRNYENSMTITAAMVGSPVRVAIAWHSFASAGCGVPGGACANVLGADLDLYVIAPNDVTVVCNSLSIPNAWEMCQFTPTVAGAYDIEVRRFSNVAGWPGTFIGRAWSTATALPNFCTGAAAQVAALGVINRNVNTTNGPTFFDSYAAWPFAQESREAVIPLNTTALGVRDITIRDTNANQDLHVISIPSCTTNPIAPVILGQGDGTAGSLFINNLPPGQYYIVVDGRTDAAGLPVATAIGANNVTVTVAGP